MRNKSTFFIGNYWSKNSSDRNNGYSRNLLKRQEKSIICIDKCSSYKTYRFSSCIVMLCAFIF
jgi:hypothetical protein